VKSCQHKPEDLELTLGQARGKPGLTRALQGEARIQTSFSFIGQTPIDAGTTAYDSIKKFMDGY